MTTPPPGDAKVLADADDRHAALHDFSHNLVVIAGAGTGKTSLLVGRILAALTLQHIEPHQLLALTFTENAAAEMQERLQRLLVAFEPWLAGEPVHDGERHVLAALDLGPEFVSRIRELRERAEELRVSTFHGFCLRLLRDNARALDLPPNLRIEDEDVAREEFEIAFVEFVRAQSELHEALRIHEAPLLRNFAWQLTQLPEDCWDHWDPDLRPTDLPAHRDRLEQLLQSHSRARSAWRSLGEALLAVYDDLIADRSPRAVELPRQLRAPSAGSRELGKEQSEHATASMQEHLDLLLPQCLEDSEGIAQALDFLRPFLTDYRQARLNTGALTFDDLLLVTRQYLLRDAGFRRRAGGALRAMLVDEFQDTDPLQYDVIFLLAADDAEIESPLDARLRPAVLYIVGDASQSIYRFRRADVAAFASAVGRVLAQDGRELHLVSNFRSRPPILEFVHRVCSRSLAEERPYQFGYQQVLPTVAAADEDAVEILEQTDSNGSDARRVQEGQQVIAAVRDLLRRGYAHGDMAVLLRAAQDLSWLLRPLREAGIPYVLEGSKLFYRRHEVTLATALISAVARPQDPVAVLAVLRSALVGARDEEIARYLEDHALDYRNAEGSGPVAAGLRWLDKLHRELITLPVDEALAAILTHPRLIITEGSGFEGAQRLANLERLLERLLSRGTLDLRAAAEWLARNTDVGTQDEESPLFDDGTDALRILTVHRAKGLEFDVVIVPDLARKLQTRQPRIQAQRLFSARGVEMVAMRLDRSRNVASAIAQVEANHHQLAEERRLFYVAATRARKQLVLLCGHGTDKRAVWREDLRRVPEHGPGTVFRELSAAPEPAPQPHERSDASTVLAAMQAQRDLVTSLEKSTPPESLPPSALGKAVPSGSGAPSRERALEVGRAMHRYLAAVDLQRETTDETLLAGEHSDLRGEVGEMAARFHDSELRRRLVAATRVLREVPLAYGGEDGQLVRGTIDALVVEGDRITVLDYKTDRQGDREEQVRAHQPQLVAYGRGVQKAMGLPQPPGLELHFLRDDHTHPLEPR